MCEGGVSLTENGHSIFSFEAATMNKRKNKSNRDHSTNESSHCIAWKAL